MSTPAATPIDAAGPGSEQRADARRTADVRAFCQRPFATADEPCWQADVRDLSFNGLGLVLPCRLEPDAPLTVELCDPSRPSSTLFVRVVHTTPLADGRWLTGCVLLAPRNPSEPEGRAPRAGNVAADVVAPAHRLPPPRPAWPALPWRQALGTSLGWAGFLVLLLYLANAHRLPTEPDRWTTALALTTALLGAVAGLAAALVPWSAKVMVHGVKRLFRRA